MEIFGWLFIFSLTASFFFNSLSGRSELVSFSILIFEALLLAFALASVYFAFRDRESSVLKRKQRNKMQSLLSLQRKILENRFDLKKKLGDLPLSGSAESLNLVKKGEEKINPLSKNREKIIEMDLPNKKETQGTINLSEVNLAQKLVQGEDISAFPPEWRNFFIENEERTTVEKLNRLFDWTKN